MRLATRLGCLDVDAMLDAMTPAQFAERWAEQVIDGWGETWHRHGELCAEVHNAGLRTAAAMGAKVDEAQIRVAGDYLPDAEQPKPKTLTAEESRALAEARYGG